MTAVFAPPPDLPPRLQQYRFWIWLQLVAIRLYVIALRGSLVDFATATDRQGNVYLVHIGDAQPNPAPKPDPFAFEPSAAYRAALFGDAPDHLSFRRHPRRRVSTDGSVLPFLWTLLSMDARLRGHQRRYEETIPDT